jgi:hypothetical protein|eukprot:g5194.t1
MSSVASGPVSSGRLQIKDPSRAWKLVLSTQEEERNIPHFYRRRSRTDVFDAWEEIDPAHLRDLKRQRFENTFAAPVPPPSDTSSSSSPKTPDRIEPAEKLKPKAPETTPSSPTAITPVPSFKNDSEIVEYFRRPLGEDVNYVPIVRSALLPLVSKLKQPASRTLVSCIVEIAKEKSSRAVLAGLFVPMVSPSSSGASVSKHQYELVTRVCKSLGVDFAIKFLSEAMPVMSLDEGSFPMLKTLLSMPLGLSVTDNTDLILAMLRQFETSCEKFKKSLKFASVVHAFVTKNLPVAKLYAPQLEHILQKCETFLSKTTMKQLASKR